MRIDTNGPVIFSLFLACGRQRASSPVRTNLAFPWRSIVVCQGMAVAYGRARCISLMRIAAGKQLLERLFGIQPCPPHLRHNRLQQTRAAEADPVELTHVVFPKPLIAAAEKALSKKFVVVREMPVETNSILGIGQVITPMS